MIQVQTDHNLSGSMPIICMHRQCQKRCPLMVSNSIQNWKMPMKVLQEMLRKKFGTLNYKVKIHLPIGKNKTLIELIKDELGGKIMNKITALRPNMYSHLTDDNPLAKKPKKNKELK